MKIRPATFDDLPAILEIYNDAVLHTTASYDYEPRTLADRVTWFEQHQKEGFPVFVAADPAGQVVGWSSLSRFHARIGYQFTAENSVYIAASHRGQGIGKLLLSPLITSACERGFHAILALIDAENAASVRLHASLGFQQVALLKQVGFKFSRWLDVIFMERLIADKT